MHDLRGEIVDQRRVIRELETEFAAKCRECESLEADDACYEVSFNNVCLHAGIDETKDREAREEELCGIVKAAKDNDAEIARLSRECEQASDRIANLTELINANIQMRMGDFWIWLGDGTDHPESWCNSLVVGIRAPVFREMLTELTTLRETAAADQRELAVLREFVDAKADDNEETCTLFVWEQVHGFPENDGATCRDLAKAAREAKP